MEMEHKDKKRCSLYLILCQMLFVKFHFIKSTRGNNNQIQQPIIVHYSNSKCLKCTLMARGCVIEDLAP